MNITHQAIRNVHSDVVTISGVLDATDNDNNPVILDQSLVDIEVTRLQAEYDANQYQRDRQYPPMADQLDDIFHNGVAGWKETIQAVKDTYPKP